MPRVLIVEDNPANMTLATFLVESAGHTVISATDAEAGLTLARDERPQLILMDIQLPGMDGLQATALLKREDTTRDIPVIALTAHAMKGDRERCLKAGLDDFVPKPIRPDELFAALEGREGGPGQSETRSDSTITSFSSRSLRTVSASDPGT